MSNRYERYFRAWEVKTLTEERENYIDYKKFKSDDSTSFKTYIDNGLIHKQKFPKHTGLAAGYIIESIYEIYANATMHGKQILYILAASIKKILISLR